jgi:hypothetical protein
MTRIPLCSYILKDYFVDFLYLSLRASRSDSIKIKISPSLTGPLTFLMIDLEYELEFEGLLDEIVIRIIDLLNYISYLVVSSMNSTLTWVTPPREPVRPRSLITLASFG